MLQSQTNSIVHQVLQFEVRVDTGSNAMRGNPSSRGSSKQLGMVDCEERIARTCRFAEAKESAFATDGNICRGMAAVNRQQIESRPDWRLNSAHLIGFLRQIGQCLALAGE